MRKLRYNGMVVPDSIPTNRIISAFANEIDQAKLEKYTDIMEYEMLEHPFPPIKGFPAILTDEDIANNYYFLTGEEAMETHIGETVWFVTDGHHRAFAAIEARLPYLETKLDRSTITVAEELQEYDKFYS